MLRYSVAAAAVWIGLGPAAVAAAGASWQEWVSVPGVVDLDGPRSDGNMVVAGSAALYLADPAAGLQPFARGAGGYREDPGRLTYLAVSPGGHVASSACDFAPDETYILRLHTPLGVNRVSADGTASGSFVNVGIVTDLSGIAFDNVGSFEHRLLVMGPVDNNTNVFAIDCNGVGRFVTRSLPLVEGPMAVAPEGFGAFGGNLIVTDRIGRVLAVDPGGKISTVVARPPDQVDTTLNGLGFVPAGFMERGGAVYRADRVTPGSKAPGTDHLLRLSSSALATAGVQDGDLLVSSSIGAALVSVHCAETCTAVTVVGSSGAHGVGRIAFSVNAAPSPSPVSHTTQTATISPGLVDFVGAWGVPLGLVVIVLVFGAGIGVAAMRRRGR